MPESSTLVLLYILFIWTVLLHTFEEIAQEIFTLKIGPITMTRRKYLLGASGITTLNLATLALLVAGNRLGLYLGLFTSSVIGCLQLPVHALGFFAEGRKPRRVGAGFYSSIPLAAVGLALLIALLKSLG